MAVVTSCDPFQAAEGADAGTQSPRKIGKTGKEVTSAASAGHACVSYCCAMAADAARFERVQQEM